MARRAKKQIPVERLHELFALDHTTGQLFWKARTGPMHWNTRYAGKCAGGLANNGYIYISINNSRYLAHLIVWAMANGKWSTDEVDHRDGIPRNNNLVNLREAIHAEQGQNLKLRSNNTSGYTGVYFHKKVNRWFAMIMVNGTQHYLGIYGTPEQARDAYREAKAKLHLFQPMVREA